DAGEEAVDPHRDLEVQSLPAVVIDERRLLVLHQPEDQRADKRERTDHKSEKSRKMRERGPGALVVRNVGVDEVMGGTGMVAVSVHGRTHGNPLPACLERPGPGFRSSGKTGIADAGGPGYPHRPCPTQPPTFRDFLL